MPYINSDHLLSEIEELKKSPWFNRGNGSGNPVEEDEYYVRKDAVECVVDMCIKAEPAADVAPIVNAKWEKIKRTAHYTDGIGVDLETGKPCIRKKEYEYDEYKCPVCKKFAKGDYLRFCDYCGARFNEMFVKDEETEEDV